MYEFFDLWGSLPSLKGQGWAVNEAGALRNTKAQCPLCALSDQVVGRPLGFTEELFSALNATGIFYHTSDATNIAHAADDEQHPHHQTLRSLLT